MQFCVTVTATVADAEAAGLEASAVRQAIDGVNRTVGKELRAGATATPDELRDWCRGKIAHFKVPRYVHVVEEFPMTVTGKVQKFKMREQAIDELRDGGCPIAVRGGHEGGVPLRLAAVRRLGRAPAVPPAAGAPRRDRALRHRGRR